VTTDGHLDTGVLAEYDEGLLDEPAASRVAEHLAQCPTCSATVQRLGDVRLRLGDAPVPPMPAAVSGRIDAALAAERPVRSRDASREPLATVHPLRRRLPQLLAAAATVAAVGFAGYVVSTSGGGDDSASIATGGGGAEAADEDSGADSGAAEQDAAESAPVPPPAPDQRTALTQQIQAVAAEHSLAAGPTALDSRLAADCGITVARDLGTELIGVAPTDLGDPGAVLVVLEAEQPGQATGVVVPSCDAAITDALTELTVPID
jgi:anti-sigma factor RsiW